MRLSRHSISASSIANETRPATARRFDHPSRSSESRGRRAKLDNVRRASKLTPTERAELELGVLAGAVDDLHHMLDEGLGDVDLGDVRLAVADTTRKKPNAPSAMYPTPQPGISLQIALTCTRHTPSIAHLNPSQG